MKYGLLLPCFIMALAATSLDASQQAPKKKRKRAQSIEQTTAPTLQSFAKSAETAAITAKDFDDEMEEICRAPDGDDSDEADIKTQQEIMVPSFRLRSTLSAAELKAEDEADEKDSDSDDDTSDERYQKLHAKAMRREKAETKAIQRMNARANNHKSRLERWVQCTNDECKKWHAITPFMSRQEYEAIMANTDWTCSDNYWNVGDSFCDEIDEDGKKIEGGIIRIEGSPEEIEAAIRRGLAAAELNAKSKQTAATQSATAKDAKADSKEAKS